MSPIREWLKTLQGKQELLLSWNDANRYFNQLEIAGMAIDSLDLGYASYPIDQILVCNPLYYLDRNQHPYLNHIPVGYYPVTACDIKPTDDDCASHAAVNMTIAQNEPVHFEQALKGDEDLTELSQDDYFGFAVDAGLAYIADIKTRDEYCRFKSF